MEFDRFRKEFEMNTKLLEKMLLLDGMLYECILDSLHERETSQELLDKVKELTKSIEEAEFDCDLYRLESLKEPETEADFNAKESIVARLHKHAQKAYLGSEEEPGYHASQDSRDNLGSLSYVAFKAFVETSRVSDSSGQALQKQDNGCISFTQRWEPKQGC
ncbi:MAG: hypothetical protein LBC41_09835 [Clostridiales bacterium]|jgi:hypothetical protein|nr:hypothetical protein [Clostridiales bacterium]MDR2750950.1 hypothetical protein [Clostridiales bacterium]